MNVSAKVTTKHFKVFHIMSQININQVKATYTPAKTTTAV